MKTSKPISTICYLDCDTLVTRLQRIEKDHPDKFSYWAFVKHNPEKEGQKPHIHLLLVPSGTFDTETLWFKEAFYTMFNDEIVSSVKPFVTSKETDWTLYAMHNSQYLMKKGLDRKFHYFKGDFFYNDFDWFDELCDSALASVRTCIEKMESCIKQGLNVFQAMAVCGVPYGSMRAFFDVYNSMNDFIKNVQEEVEENA